MGARYDIHTVYQIKNSTILNTKIIIFKCAVNIKEIRFKKLKRFFILFFKHDRLPDRQTETKSKTKSQEEKVDRGKRERARVTVNICQETKFLSRYHEC